MDWELFIKFMQNFGFPVVCVMALSMTIWKVVKWIGINFIKPGVDAHISLVNTLRDSIIKQDKTLIEMSYNLERLAGHQDKIGEAQIRLADKLTVQEKK